MVSWNAASFENRAAPAQALALFERAVAAAPDRFEPLYKLGNIYVDLYRSADAARVFAAALRLKPGDVPTVIRLAHALNETEQYDAALSAMAGIAPDDSVAASHIHYMRGVALAARGQGEEAQDAWRAALDRNPNTPNACARLGKAMRQDGRMTELLDLCEQLAAQGVNNGQLRLDWGRALAIAGEDDKARALLFDPARVTRQRLALPEGFDAAFADELLGSDYQLGELPKDEANVGSRRVHHLVNGKRPDLVRTLMGEIRKAVEGRIAALDAAQPPSNRFDPWAAARPRSAYLHAWGLIQIGGDYEAWHTHRGGWMSGVYYVRVPRGIAQATDGRGALEFGPPPYLAETRPGFIAPRHYVPEEGVLVLAPSHYHHRTIPSGLPEYRVSFAFDVVPEAP